jgi:flavin-binding protein dodecin
MQPQSTIINHTETDPEDQVSDTLMKVWNSMSVGTYKIIELVGSSAVSWEDAAKNAVETASKTLRDLRIAEVKELDLKIEEGKVVAYRARLHLSFKYMEKE